MQISFFTRENQKWKTQCFLLQARLNYFGWRDSVWISNSISVFIKIYFQKLNIFQNVNITKTRLYSFDPLKPHFYMVKLGFTRYTLIFLFLLKTQIMGTR